MKHPKLTPALACCLAVALAGLAADVHAEGAEGADGAVNTLKLGYAHIGFNTRSGDLSGPAGTTLPGIQAALKNVSTLALVYERKLSGPWSFAAQVGTPSVIRIVGAGNGAALGQVGSTRAVFPAVLANYGFDGPWGVRPYVGAGLNYTFYTDGHVSPAYTAAFGGSSSTATLKPSWGPVFELGVAFPVGQGWVIDVAYARYVVRTTATITTATPGVGNIARSVDVRSDPDVVGVVLGYRF